MNVYSSAIIHRFLLIWGKYVCVITAFLKPWMIASLHVHCTQHNNPFVLWKIKQFLIFILYKNKYVVWTLTNIVFYKLITRVFIQEKSSQSWERREAASLYCRAAPVLQEAARVPVLTRRRRPITCSASSPHSDQTAFVRKPCDSAWCLLFYIIIALHFAHLIFKK